jgi:hypothetical protein
MSIKFKNVVCEPKDVIGDIKRQILELISLNQTICNNLPNLSLPTSIPDVSDLDISQRVVDLLNDILATISGINIDEMRMQLISWLVEQLQPLSEDLSLTMIDTIKCCYACKINPTIPNWLFVTDPSTILYDNNGVPIPNSGTPGIGMNIELNKLDLTCLFAVDPNSTVGKLFYDGTETDDLNAFLWKVIQENGNPVVWLDPTSGKQIAEFRYFENSNTAFIESDGTTDYQNIESRPRVFNIRIINETYQNKTMITFLVDYFNSQNPLFNVDKVVPNIIDIIYGSLTNKVDLPDECLNKVVETEKSIEDYLDKGIGNPEVVFDESFYTFTPAQIANIKETVKEKKLGVKQFKKCCAKQTSSISFETLKEIDDNIAATSTLQEKIEVYTKSLDDLINESIEGVKNLDKDGASGEFLANFISALQVALTKIALTPKNLVMLNLFYFLVNSQPIKKTKIKEILKEFECILSKILGDLLRKIIYEFLLPMILKALKQIVLCAIRKKIKEINENFLKTKRSLLPPFVNDTINAVEGLLGKAENVVDDARGFTDKVNLDSLSNLNLFNNKGRFCE